MSASTPTCNPVAETLEPRYLRRVDVRAVLVIAAAFNAVVGVVFMLAGFMVILVAAQRGVFDQVNTVTADLGTSHPVHVGALQLAFVWMLIVIGWTVVVTGLVGLAAVIFNSVLGLVGGIELDLRTTRGERPDVGVQARRVLAVVVTGLQSIVPKPASQLGAERDEAEASAT